MTSRDFRRMFQKPCKLTDEPAQAIPILPVKNQQHLVDAAHRTNQMEENRPTTQSGNDRFFCGQKVKYTEKGSNNKMSNRAIRMGNLDPRLLPPESPSPATYFEDQELVFVNEGNGNIEESVNFDFGNMGAWPTAVVAHK